MEIEAGRVRGKTGTSAGNDTENYVQLRRSSPELTAALALGCVYLAVMSGHLYSIDGMLMYRQAVSIVYDHSLLFSHPIWWGDVFTTSKYGIGLSLLYVPGVAVVSWFASPPLPPTGGYDWNLFYQDPVYLFGAAPVHALIGAASAYLVARSVRALGHGRWPALLALAGYGLASPALAYARGDFSQPLLGLCLTGGFLAAIRYRQSGRLPHLLVASAALLYGVLTRPVEGSFLLPALLALVWISPQLGRLPGKRIRDVLTVAGAYLLAIAITGLINWSRAGTPLATGYGGGWTTPLWVGLPGLLASPARGILFEFPLVVLAPFGLRDLWRNAQRVEAVAMLGVVVALLLSNALWASWWGSWSWGSRLLEPSLPLLAIAAGIGAVHLSSRARRWLPATLFAAGMAWAVPATFTDLLAGYAGTNDSGDRSWSVSAYPPIGAWTFLRHLRSSTLGDNTGVDILWFRLARSTGELSILVPVALLGLAGALAVLALRRARSEALYSASALTSVVGAPPQAETHPARKIG